MALSMLRQETTQWETVKSRRADRRKKETLEKGAQSAAQVVPGLPDNEKNAFAAFDALHSETARRQADGSNGRRSPENGTHVPKDETPHGSEDTARQIGKKKDKKKKQQSQQQQQQKAKELPPKTSAAPAPSPGLTSQSLKSILKDVTVRYPDNDVAQLQYVTDKFLPAFKDKAIPFPAEIYIKPVEETVDMLQGLLSSKMSADLAKFLESKSIGALVESFASFCGALFDLTSGPKANLKDHLGLVVMIASIARASPIAVVRCGRTLMSDGPRFTAPNKLPLLVWVFAQAERASPGSMLALWLQVILPQLLGVDLEQAKGKKSKGKKDQQMYVLDPKNYTIVSDCLKRALSGGNKSVLSTKIKEAGKEGLKMKCNGVEVTEPVVSLLSLNMVQCAIWLDLTVPIPSQILSPLKDLYPTLRSLAFACASHTALHDFLKFSLEFAAKSEGGYLGRGDRIVDEATENVIRCLLNDSECFDVWTTKHKGQIRGSCRVLQHLLHAPSPSFQKLLATPANKTLFLKMVKKFQDRHGILLAQAKGWQGACARGAHEACKEFLEHSDVVTKKRSRGVSPLTLFVTFALIGLSVAVVSAKWSDLSIAITEFLGSDQGKVVEENWARVKAYAQKVADSEAGQWVFGKLDKAMNFAAELAGRDR